VFCLEFVLREAPDIASTIEPATFRQRLRQDTGAAHMRLEAALDLLGGAPDKARFTRVLERFLGFHIAWEAALASGHPALQGLLAGRSRLPHLRRDLSALGRTNAEQARLDVCAEAADLSRSRASAVGSIYVLEGSTLGGQLISRAMSGVGWTPPGGLTYFAPYGSRTGEMWRSFAAWADEAVPHAEWVEAASGANRTFALLEAWLTS
jgi:heme oxygenase